AGAERRGHTICSLCKLPAWWHSYRHDGTISQTHCVAVHTPIRLRTGLLTGLPTGLPTGLLTSLLTGLLTGLRTGLRADAKAPSPSTDPGEPFKRSYGTHLPASPLDPPAGTSRRLSQ